MRLKAGIAGVVIACSVATGTSQGRVTRYDLASHPTVDVGTALRIKKIMGQAGTFMIGTFQAGWKNTPHHHTHEQINIGVQGRFNIVTPVSPHEVSRLRGLLIPPDVMHGNDVTAETVSPVLIEFQPVRRVDFPPEREKVSFPRAAEPVPTPAEVDLDFRSGSSTWKNVIDGVRLNVKKGRGAALSAWEFTAAARRAVDLAPQVAGAELFVYVLEGHVDLVAAGETHSGPADTLLVAAPNTASMQLRPKGASIVLIFEAAKAP